MLLEGELTFLQQVLQPEDPRLRPAAREDVQVAVAIQVDRPRVHWHGDRRQHRLGPTRIDQGIAVDPEQGHLFEREGVRHRLALRLLRPRVRRAGPATRTVASEVEPDMVAVLVDGHDVQVAIAVQVGHLQAVGAAQRYAAGQFLVVDAMLPPGDELAALGLRGRGRLGYRERLAGCRRVARVRTRGSAAGQERQQHQQTAEHAAGLSLFPLARSVRRSRDAHASPPTPRGSSHR